MRDAMRGMQLDSGLRAGTIVGHWKLVIGHLTPKARESLRELSGLKGSPAREGTGPLPDVGLELFPEVLEVTLDGHGRRIAQDADGLPLHVVAHVQEHIQVLFAPLAVLDPPQDLVEPGRALAALGALAAGFVVV